MVRPQSVVWYVGEVGDTKSSSARLMGEAAGMHYSKQLKSLSVWGWVMRDGRLGSIVRVLVGS